MKHWFGKVEQFPHAEDNAKKVVNGVVKGHSLVINANLIHEIQVIRLSPLGVVEEAKFRIIHDLKFAGSGNRSRYLSRSPCLTSKLLAYYRKGQAQSLSEAVLRVERGTAVEFGDRGCVVVDTGKSSKTRYLLSFSLVRDVFSSSTLLFRFSYLSIFADELFYLPSKGMFKKC